MDFPGLIVLVAVIVGCVLTLWWLIQWDDGDGLPGRVKRSLAFNRAKRASDEIADDGKRRIRDL
ncbi:hypothetical protein [Kribbella sp. NPDC023855]|uniref:hypothetical protein n=1 Tax=Kribbella sp. NPDC023855 TaxID=3154698 RepID=UPI0033F8171A